jgi:hypothetical protein
MLMKRVGQRGKSSLTNHRSMQLHFLRGVYVLSSLQQMAQGGYRQLNCWRTVTSRHPIYAQNVLEAFSG